MHFTQMNDKGGTKFSKLAVVAALHVAVGAMFVHSLNSRGIKMPKMPEELVVMFTPEAPPPPPEPPRPMPKTAPPQVIAPPVEVEVQQPPPPDAVAAVVSTDPAPQPATPSQAPEAPAAPPASNTGVMHTAVLADANGCGKPDYPLRAARNGESGTVTLALLVGTDGKVANSRVQKSSGSKELDRAAISALSMCTFKPAMSGGVPEQAWAQIAYVWTLEQ